MTASPGTVQWHCPYCEETQPTLREIQQHITQTATGDHEGISGESPDEDIIATDEDGDEVDVYAATDVVRPQNAPLENASKRKQVVYAWLANDRDEDVDAITAVTNADRDYTGQILGQIQRGEITREYWADDMDRQLLSALKERLEEYEPSEEDGDNTGESEEMSTQQDETADDVPSVSAKTIVLNTYDLAGEDINRKQAWTALSDAGVIDAGYEYFRRTYKEAIDGEHDVEDAVDEQVQTVIDPVLYSTGINSNKSDDTEQSDQPTESTETGSASRDTGSGGVSVDELRNVREKVELLREQAEYEGAGEDSAAARRAEFIGNKAVEWIDDLIDSAES